MQESGRQEAGSILTVVGVPDRADGGLETGDQQGLGALHRSVLTARIAVVNSAARQRFALASAAGGGVADRTLNEPDLLAGRAFPAHDPPGEGVDESTHASQSGTA